MTVLTRLRTIAALGPANVARVAAYRLSLKTGLGRVQRLRAAVPQRPFFRAYGGPARTLPVRQAWRHHGIYFGWRSVPFAGDRPDWFLNPLTGGRVGAGKPWWRIPDFDVATGDIKIIWEPSRFDWVLSIAQGIAAHEPGEAERLEGWLDDWCRQNPPYLGPNWKCGQETSIRVMHLAMAALILGDADEPLPGLRHLLRVHLQRIAPTIAYAIGQDNNHGTSEAAALFIGGAWLGDADGRRWGELGRRLLENRVARLVAADGSFSQHSLTYHRALIDTLSMAEIWRRRRGLPPFSAPLRARASAAAEWLFAMVRADGGDGPNLGSNDGARLFPLTDTGYRDFRPSVQMAMALFEDRRAYDGEGAWNLPLRWLGIALPEAHAVPAGSRLFDDGGYAVLRAGETMALLRYPRFRFRPAQADALHVDLWIAGRNLLRDAGTFSYHADRQTLDAFAGTAGHNTVQFDGRDQMPRLGRFLFGEWLSAEGVRFDAERGEAEAGYTDWCGAAHHRSIALEEGRLTVRDRLSGRFASAVLRWRLAPGHWTLDGCSIDDGVHRLQVAGDAGIVRSELVHGRESLHYLDQNEAPVLEIEVRGSGILTSEFTRR